ncbi:MAG: 3-isopropylmalate dehydratase small subunit LeuD [Candidatus Methanohalarchaeum thermophilum]|uniref:3-isopropylmalate dehydratase small subunit n=1 Tax=Methanohalarchaeum thermophilum TaxID=1903181 RepID=A0A1Q6DT57_METT1|nr:MAG: 3-isopropylmalate dehydratase small subunit LeuD [Candidatus Methanohalarchaeum thermophilum]
MNKAWKFGDDVSTDAIIPGRYLTLNKPEKLAEHVFENERENFADKVEEGDYIVAGENFGCGSSREHAPLAIKGAGIKAIIAKSFARIFYRNAINLGILAIECGETDEIEEEDELEINKNTITDKTKDKTFEIEKKPEFIEEIVQKDGLLPYVKEEYLDV